MRTLSRIARAFRPPCWSSAEVAAGVSLVALTILYISLAGRLTPFETFWNPDAGVRFWMIRNWVEHESLLYLHYPAGSVDPDGQVHPLGGGPGYLVPLNRGLVTLYPPLFPFLSSFPYRQWGFSGLLLLPILSGLATVALVTLTARRMRLRCWFALPVITGLATPLVLYSVVFWDHATYICLATATVYLLYDALERDLARSAMLAGAVLGLGVFFHEVFVVLAAAVMITGAMATHESAPRRLTRYVALGFCALCIAWLASNIAMYGVPTGPHLLGANDLTSPELVRRALTVEWMALRGLRQITGQNGWMEPFLLLLVVYALCSWIGGPAGRWRPVLAIGAAVVSLSVSNSGRVVGLMSAAPVFIPALAGCWYLSFPSRRDANLIPDLFECWLSRTAVLFTALVLLVPIGEGGGWGNRALLTGLPLLVLVSARVTEQQFFWSPGDRPRHHTWLVLVSTAALVAVSGYSQYLGWDAMSRQMSASKPKRERLQMLSKEIVVTEDDMLGPMGAAARPFPELYWLRSEPEYQRKFAEVLNARAIDRFVYLGEASTATSLELLLQDVGVPFKMRGKGQQGWSFIRRRPPTEPGDATHLTDRPGDRKKHFLVER